MKEYPELNLTPPGQAGRKKVDQQALNSAFCRIPGIDAATARDLLDLGYDTIDSLRGRAPESLFESMRARKPLTPPLRLAALRLLVYIAETPEPDASKLNLWSWQR